MKSVIAGLLSFIVGIMCYALTLELVWGESLGGDVYAVLYWGGMGFITIPFPIYLMTTNLIEARCSKQKYFFYPLSCMLVYFVPAAFLTLIFGGVLAIFSEEAMLFHSFFLSSGFIFGITIWFFRRKEVQNT